MTALVAGWEEPRVSGDSERKVALGADQGEGGFVFDVAGVAAQGTEASSGEDPDQGVEL